MDFDPYFKTEPGKWILLNPLLKIFLNKKTLLLTCWLSISYNLLLLSLTLQMAKMYIKTLMKLNHLI